MKFFLRFLFKKHSLNLDFENSNERLVSIQFEHVHQYKKNSASFLTDITIFTKAGESHFRLVKSDRVIRCLHERQSPHYSLNDAMRLDQEVEKCKEILKAWHTDIKGDLVVVAKHLGVIERPAVFGDDEFVEIDGEPPIPNKERIPITKRIHIFSVRYELSGLARVKSSWQKFLCRVKKIWR